MDFLNDDEKYLLAVYFKRMTYDNALEASDGGDDKNMAYRILEVVGKVQRALADQGFAPR
jgi:hypothetical protein